MNYDDPGVIQYLVDDAPAIVFPVRIVDEFGNPLTNELGLYLVATLRRRGIIDNKRRALTLGGRVLTFM